MRPTRPNTPRTFRLGEGLHRNRVVIALSLCCRGVVVALSSRYRCIVIGLSLHCHPERSEGPMRPASRMHRSFASLRKTISCLGTVLIIAGASESPASATLLASADND
jgi:hypothetical protein